MCSILNPSAIRDRGEAQRSQAPPVGCLHTDISGTLFCRRSAHLGILCTPQLTAAYADTCCWDFDS